MKLGIYARGLSGMGGVKQYIDSMTRAVIALLDDGDELCILHNLEQEYFCSSRRNVSEILLPSKNRLVCDHILAPKKIRELGLDVVWFTKYVVPFGVGCKTITTVHDMAYYLPHIGAYTFLDTLYMRTMIRNSCKRADGIVAVSSNTRNDLVSMLRIQPTNVSVIYEAADPRFVRVEDGEQIGRFKEAYNLPDKFILFAGNISPRKNLLRLVKAFLNIAPRIEHKLVVTGIKQWQQRDLLGVLEENDRMIKLGFVEDQDMPLLYSCADLLVYPSLYEGFGLPILEAQSCGCPVACSKGSSLTEVGGDAVQFFDPYDEKDMADSMLEVLGDRSLAESLVGRGYRNVKRFDWSSSARQLLDIVSATG